MMTAMLFYAALAGWALAIWFAIVVAGYRQTEEMLRSAIEHSLEKLPEATGGQDDEQ